MSPLPSDVPFSTSAQSWHLLYCSSFFSFSSSPSSSSSSFFFSFTTYGVVDGVHSYKKWTWGKDSPSFLSLNLYIPQHNLHKLYFYQELVLCLWTMMCASFWYCLLCTWPLSVASQVRNSAWCQWSHRPGLITALAPPRSALAWLLPAASSLLFPFTSHRIYFSLY